MKNKWIIMPMIFGWFLFIALDTATGFFHTAHMLKKNKLVNMFFQSIKFLKGSTIFIIAILNFILLSDRLSKSR
ncbi:MAG TPA: hypothetical protein VHP36_00235 [Chitinispirillaceae bacterium]|nr:hypothetical protein [Chitinispirillaceae bacterium]